MDGEYYLDSLISSPYKEKKRISDRATLDSQL